MAIPCTTATFIYQSLLQLSWCIRMPLPTPLSSPIHNFQLNTFDTLLWPYQYLDISSLYQAYSGLIDFFVYVLIFVGAAQVTLGQRFPGNGGKAISTGTGLILAVGMIVLEERLGFSLKSFGPIAAGIVMLLLGVMIFRLLHQAGLAPHKAGSIAYLALFTFLAAVMPSLFTWLRDRAPLIGLILMILFILSLVGAVSAAWPSSFGAGFEGRLRQTQQADPEARQLRQAFKGETRFMKRAIKPIAKRNVKDSKTILNDLSRIKDAIARYGNDPKARPIILEQISSVLPKQHALLRNIQNLASLSGQVQRLDASLLDRKRRQQLAGLAPEKRELLHAELRGEAAKLGIDQRVAQLENALDKNSKQSLLSLDEAANRLRAGQPDQALQAMQEAIAAEQATAELAQTVNGLEQDLLSLAKRDFKLEKRLQAT